jgi:hypothetical protein
MAKPIKEASKYVVFFHPELFLSVSDSVKISSTERKVVSNMFSLLKAVYLSFRYGVDGPFRRRQNELCITGSFDRYPMKNRYDKTIVS